MAKRQAIIETVLAAGIAGAAERKTDEGIHIDR